jgi:hypothetical protein
MQGRKTGFKHSDDTIKKMKITKAETTQKKTEIDAYLDFIIKSLYNISKSNHSVSITLLKQFEEIIKSHLVKINDKKVKDIIDINKQSIISNNNEIFDKLFEMIDE